MKTLLMDNLILADSLKIVKDHIPQWVILLIHCKLILDTELGKTNCFIIKNWKVLEYS